VSQDVFIDRLQRAQCSPTVDNGEKADAKVAKWRAVFCAHFRSEPDKRNVSVRRGPGRC